MRMDGMQTPESTVDAGTQSDWKRLGQVIGAHVVMLHETGILDEAGAAVVLRAVDATAAGTPPAAQDLTQMLAAFDERLDALSPSGASGGAALGRAQPDIVATLVRMSLREHLLAVDGAVAAIRRALLDLADEHVFSLMSVAIDGRPAQVSTVAHILGGAISPLARAMERLHQMFDRVNRSPLGAAALSGSTLPVDREGTAALLGFDGVLHNTFDAVSAVDHLSETAVAVVDVVAPSRRLVGELIAWNRAEPDSFRVTSRMMTDADAAVLPLDGAAMGLTRLFGELMAIERNASAVADLARDAPYGVATTTLNVLIPTARRLLTTTTTSLTALGQIIGEVEINRAYLANRAGRDHTTSGELAEYLMMEEGIDPGAARTITAMTIRRAREQGTEASGITPAMIDAAALMVVGRELGIETEAIGRHLAPRRVIERRSSTGTPAPLVTRSWLANERETLTVDERWQTRVRARLDEAARGLDNRMSVIVTAEGPG